MFYVANLSDKELQDGSSKTVAKIEALLGTYSKQRKNWRTSGYTGSKVNYFQINKTKFVKLVKLLLDRSFNRQ